MSAIRIEEAITRSEGNVLKITIEGNNSTEIIEEYRDLLDSLNTGKKSVDNTNPSPAKAPQKEANEDKPAKTEAVDETDFGIDDPNELFNDEEEEEAPPVKKASPKTSSKSDSGVVCGICKSGVWDNRADKKTPKSPDFKCKKCGAVAWVDKKGGKTLKWVESKF